jgi:hypothetical protein
MPRHLPAVASPRATTSPATTRRVDIAQTYQLDNPAYRPRGVGMSGDGVWEIGHVVWSSWTTRHAIGRGVSYEHNCLPSCAQGRRHHYPIELTWTHPHEYCGRWYFTRLRRVYPDQHSKGAKKSLTINFTDMIGHSPCHPTGLTLFR